MTKAAAKAAAKASVKTKTLPYDVAEQLRTPEEMAAYLDAWLSEAPGDAAGIARALGDIARAKGMSQVARDAGLTAKPQQNIANREQGYSASMQALPLTGPIPNASSFPHIA